MAHYIPKNNEDFSKISGVGQQKLTQFAKVFLHLITTFAEENQLTSKSIPFQNKKSKQVSSEGSTYKETKKLILQKLAIEKIAKSRGIKKAQ